MDRRQSASGSYLENTAIAARKGGRVEARAALARCSVEVSIAPLGQLPHGHSSIAPCQRMHRRQGARRSYLENGAVVQRAAKGRHPIKVPIAPLGKPGRGTRPIDLGKGMKRG